MQHKKTSARVLSLVLTMAMLLSLLPTAVFATEGTVPPMVSEMPACHTAHGADCGYMEAVAGTPAVAEVPCDKSCGDIHAEGCAYAAAVAEVPCDMSCGDIHAEGCAYAAAVVEVPCDKSCGDIHAEGCAYAAAVAEVPAIVGAACAHTCDVCQPKGALTAEETAARATPERRTTSLDLTSTSISYVNSEGVTIDAANPTTTSITDTGEGWSWELDSKTLTLDGANIVNSTPVSADSITKLFGVQLPDGAEIKLTDGSENTIKSGDTTGFISSTAVLSDGALTISGKGALIAMAGSTEPGTRGIQCSDLTITASNITATGGECKGAYGAGVSAGIVASNSITITDGAIVSANGGKVMPSEPYVVQSRGLDTKVLTINNSVLNATALEVNANTYSSSIGINAANTLTVSGSASITAAGKRDAINANAGIFAADAIVTGAKGDFESGTTKKLIQENQDTPVVISLKKMVTFDAGNGDELTQVEVGVDGKITLPTNPTWKDYTFGGWFTEKDGAGTEVTAETALTDSATVYAKWTKGGKTVYTQPIDFSTATGNLDGDGYAWDNTSKTLTLDGVNIDCSRNKVATELTYGISLPASAKIVLSAKTTNNIVAGDNGPPTAVRAESSGILGAGDITIQGKGTLTTTGGGAGGSSDNGSSYGIKINSGTISMNEGTVSATGGTSHAGSSGGTGGASNSYGIYSPFITVNGGTVNAKSDSSTGVSSAVSSGMYATEAVEINRGTVNATGGVSSGTSCGISGQTVTINSGTVNAEGVLAVDTSYGIRGTSITINGGTGTAKTTSNRETNKNAFSIQPIGTRGTTLTNALSVTWTSPTITFDAGNDQTIDAAEIVGGKITLPEAPTWEDYTFAGWFTKKDGAGTEVTAETALTASATVYAKWTAANGKTVRTESLDLTSMATTDKLSTEGWAWDKEESTLTLSGLTIHAPGGQFAIGVPGGAKIILADDTTNTVVLKGSSSSELPAAIRGNGHLTISGESKKNGKLIASNESNATEGPAVIFAQGNLIIKSGDFTLTSSSAHARGIAVEFSHSITINGGSGTISVASMMAFSKEPILADGLGLTGASNSNSCAWQELSEYTGIQAAAPNGTPAAKTSTSITLSAVTPPTGEAVEYGYSADGTAPTTWQDSTEFTGLIANTEYQFFARVKANGTHKAGTASTGTAIKTDLSDADKVAAAKAAVTTALNGFTAINATDADVIMAVATKALADAKIAGVTPTWTVAFSKTPATEDATGSVTGTIKLTCGEANDTVALNRPIAKLPTDPAAKVALAKTAIEAALNAYKPSNETTADAVKKVADDAVTAAGVTGVTTAWGTPAFAKTNSTNSANGKITGALTVTSGDKTATVSVDLTIERTDAQKLADIKLKVEIALAGMKVSNDTTADEVMAVVNKVLADTGVTATWKTPADFTLATEAASGKVSGTIVLTLNSETSDATVNLVIARLAVDKTALKTTIATANLAKKDVSINNNLAADVAEGTKFVTAMEMKTFTAAIAAAQAVANDPNATTTQVTTAGTALTAAVATFNTATKTGTFTGTATHTPIGNIEILLGTATAGTDLTLSATITPASATNKTIVWSVKTANATGATIENGKLKTTAAGTVVLTATIASGTNATTDYTQDFTITVLAASATVSGTVKDNTNIAVSGATVQLMQGKAEMKKTDTDASGNYSFADVPNGVYQLVITNATGTTITESITVNGTTVTEDINFLGSEKNTVVEITSTTPNVAVGGMNELLNPENLGTTLAPAEKVAVDNGGSVVLKFTADVKTATDVAADKAAIEAIAAGKTIDMLIDLSVLKTVKDGNDAPVGTPEKIPSLASIIEVVIPIPAQLQGQADLSIYRVHGGAAQELSKDVADANGEYYNISADGTYATLYIKNFSTYAFGYTAPVTPPSDGGSSGDTASYPNTINKPENGTVTMTPANPVKGQTVTITTKPDAGYEVDQIIVKDADGNRIAVTKTEAGGYTFVQPAGKITVEVTYKTAGTSGASAFTDVTANDWFYDAVVAAIANGWFAGTSETTFSPSTATTRGMIATILHRMAGSPSASGASFGDVAAGTWYADAIAWAQASGVVTGYQNGSYGPDDNITREQLAVILYRYATYQGYDVSKTAALSDFADGSTVSDYASEAMSWAVAAGLISGRGNNSLAPVASATRAEVATILVRFAEQFIK